jgi:hypothetical protein
MHLSEEKPREKDYVDVFDIVEGKDVPLRICTNEKIKGEMEPYTKILLPPIMEAMGKMGFKLSGQASPKITQTQCGLTSLKREISIAMSSLGLPEEAIIAMDEHLDKAIRGYKDSSGGKPLRDFAVACVTEMRKKCIITTDEAISLNGQVAAAADRCEEHALLFVEKMPHEYYESKVIYDERKTRLVHAHFVELPDCSAMFGYHDDFTNAIFECVHQVHGF